MADFLFPICDRNHGTVISPGSVNSESNLPVCDLCSQNCMYRCIFDSSYLLVGHKILSECFLLKRLQPGKVRLILCVHACHQFNIRSVLVRQVAVPCFSKFPAAPGPLLLSR